MKIRIEKEKERNRTFVKGGINIEVHSPNDDVVNQWVQFSLYGPIFYLYPIHVV